MEQMAAEFIKNTSYNSNFFCLKRTFSHSITKLNIDGSKKNLYTQILTNCDFQLVGEEFSRKPYALAVQQGSPLKDQLNDA